MKKQRKREQKAAKESESGMGEGKLQKVRADTCKWGSELNGIWENTESECRKDENQSQSLMEYGKTQQVRAEM